MITCPLCGELVKSEQGFYLSDDATEDYYCSTMVSFIGEQMTHFYRSTRMGGYPEYQFIVGPYQFFWYEGGNYLLIYQLDLKIIKRLLANDYWKRYDNLSLQDSLVIAQRLSKLKAFS